MTPSRQTHAFTLLEVMIAMGIFCMTMFAVLELVNQNLRSARLLQPNSVDASSLAAELMLTNKVEEGFASGDFGDMYPGYNWSRDIYMVSTGGLFRVDFSVSRNGGGPDNETLMSVYLFRPESKSANASAGRRSSLPGGQP
jgi:prepilin-type N-terminal cleavage/methylation domain-containing protein